MHRFVIILARSAMCLLAGCAANCALAATLTVTTSADSGPGSLRDAIASANVAGGDTIDFASDMTIVVATALTLDKSLAIDATGHAVIVDGGQLVNVFAIGANNVNVQITGLTIRNGQSSGIVSYYSGTILTLTNSTVSENHNGIYFSGGGSITLVKSLVSDNDLYGIQLTQVTTIALMDSALSGNGVGVSSNQSFTLTAARSTVSDNVGGGICNPTQSVAFTLTDSTFSGNGTAAGICGGIRTGGGTLALTNTTWSGNAAASGSAIYILGATATVTNSTFAGNSGPALTNSNGVVTLINSTFGGNNGGTVIAIHNSKTANLVNTIVIGSCSTSGPGTQIDNGGNIDSGTGCSFGVDSQSSVSVATLDLGPLQDNGGYTPTMLPGASSVAIDATACTNAPADDQRGTTRPQPAGGACDVGAVEVKGASSVTIGTPCRTTFVEGQSTTLAATVTGDGSIGGSVAFSDSAALCSGNVSSGIANCAANDLPAGEYSVTATYTGDSTHERSSSAPLALTVLSINDAVFRNDFETTTAGCPVE